MTSVYGPNAFDGAFRPPDRIGDGLLFGSAFADQRPRTPFSDRKSICGSVTTRAVRSRSSSNRKAAFARIGINLATFRRRRTGRGSAHAYTCRRSADNGCLQHLSPGCIDTARPVFAAADVFGFNDHEACPLLLGLVATVDHWFFENSFRCRRFSESCDSNKRSMASVRPQEPEMAHSQKDGVPADP